MLEILKVLVEITARAVPSLAGLRKSRKHKKIGVELFMLYARLNEFLIAGELVVSALENFIDKYEMYKDRDWYRAELKTFEPNRSLLEAITKQRQSLSVIHDILGGWSYHLNVLDGDAYAELLIKLREKNSALSFLIMELMDDRVVLGPTAAQVESLAGRVDSEREALLREMSMLFNRESIKKDGVWSRHVDIVHAYLTERNPREQLAEIRVALGKLRAVLLQNFQLKDILPEVDDWNFAVAYPKIERPLE